ncbi:hypothetical protein BFW25_10105 [Aeromonas caviae]|nr:hypothetical protein BFW25_10105 [Aeromonas caviae]
MVSYHTNVVTIISFFSIFIELNYFICYRFKNYVLFNLDTIGQLVIERKCDLICHYLSFI